MLLTIEAGVLSIAYEETGPAAGPPVILLHGFPYDVRAFDGVAPLLAAAGCRVIAPYVRGYGPTRFLSPETPRSGQQAAIAHDLAALMDALELPSVALAGFDWGGRAACIVAALWPERVRSLVVANGYTIQDIAGAIRPADPETEHRFWYQYYFHGERGRAGLAQNRRSLARLLWRLWSPDWAFDDATFERTAASFDNPDFVEIAVHSYRHRFGLAAGDPAYEATERRLAALPAISVPTVILEGLSNGVAPARSAEQHVRHFTGPCACRFLPSIGHNIPQEAPARFAEAILSQIG